MPTILCGHFSLEVEMVPVTHTSVILRVPIRRCALAERMIAVIAQNEEGREIARKLTISSSAVGTQEGGEADRIRVAFGPDLEAIHRMECSSQRCQESCTPNYRAILRQFGFDQEAERETASGCFEITYESPDALPQG